MAPYGCCHGWCRRARYDTWQAGERDEADRGRQDVAGEGHVTPMSVRRAEGEAFVPLSYGHVFPPFLRGGV